MKPENVDAAVKPTVKINIPTEIAAEWGSQSEQATDEDTTTTSAQHTNVGEIPIVKDDQETDDTPAVEVGQEIDDTPAVVTVDQNIDEASAVKEDQEFDDASGYIDGNSDEDEDEDEIVWDPKDRLREVLTGKYSWYSDKFIARFILPDEQMLPALADKCRGLWVQMGGFPVDPVLRFAITETKSDKHEYPAMLEIQARYIHSLKYKTEEQEDIVVVTVEFGSATKGIAIGLKRIRNNAILETVRQHLLMLSSTKQKVQFQFDVISQDWSDVEISLLKLREENPLPWKPYRSPISGTAMTQYGALNDREAVEELWGDEDDMIIKVPAVSYFHDLDEAMIKLVYGAFLEHQISLIDIHRLHDVSHEIVVLRVPGSNVFLAGVTFGERHEKMTPQALIDNKNVSIPDGTQCKILVTHERLQKDFKFSAISVPDVVRLDLNCNMVLLLSPLTERDQLRNIVNEWSGGSEPLNKFPCRLKFKISPKNVKAQINALTTLRKSRFENWHPILLNQEYSGLRVVDVFEGMPEEDVQRAYRDIFNLKMWNDGQRSIFELLRNVPGNGFAFVEGIFGCGKTLVQATLAKLLVMLGKHVLLVAPTNAALQALSKTLVSNYPELDAVRVVYAASKDLNRLNDDGKTKESNEELAMMGLLRSMVRVRASRYDVEQQHDLQRHVDDLANAMKDRDETLDFVYAAEGKAPEEYDAVAFYLDHRDDDSKLNGQALTKEQETDKIHIRKTLKKALQKLQDKVIMETKVILCTNQLAATHLIRHNFGHEANDIVIIADEDGQALEPTAWIPVSLLRNADRVKAVIRFGDRLQLPLLALSTTSRFSEFGPQMGRSLLDRHLSSHPPAAVLNTQYRMHPTLSEFPNFHTYQKRLRNAKSTKEMGVDVIFEARLIQWAKNSLLSTYTPDTDFTRLLGVKVSNAFFETDPVTKSRSNEAIVHVISEMLFALFEKEPYPETSITIITPYTAQRALHMTTIKSLHTYTGLPYANLPKVHTVDAMQGHESNVIILDWVIGSGDNLGFVADDRRANVALTRARTNMIVFYPESNDDAPSKKKRTTPEVIAHTRYLVKRHRTVEINGGDGTVLW
jgi:hypothetical protein